MTRESYKEKTTLATPMKGHPRGQHRPRRRLALHLSLACISITTIFYPIYASGETRANTQSTQNQNANRNTRNTQEAKEPFHDDPFWTSLPETEKKLLKYFGINAASRLHEYINGISEILSELGDKEEESLAGRQTSPINKNTGRRQKSRLLAAMDNTSVALIENHGKTVFSYLINESIRLESRLKEKMSNITAEQESRLNVKQRLEKLARLLRPQSEISKEARELIAPLVREANSQRGAGNYIAAIKLWEEIAEITKTANGNNHPDTAFTLNNLAVLQNEQGKFEKAELLHKQALAIREASFGANHPEVATSLNGLAVTYSDQGKYEIAKPLFQRALRIRETSLGPNDPATASTLGDLANLYLAQGSIEVAEATITRAIRIDKNNGREGRPEAGFRLIALAGILERKGQNAEAEPLLLNALTIFETELGADHPHIASILNRLGNLYVINNEYTKAELALSRALSINERALPPQHPLVASSLNNLAELYRQKKEYDKAKDAIMRSLSIRESISGFDHPDTATALSILGAIYRDLGLYDEAKNVFSRSLKIQEKTLPLSHPSIATSLSNLALTYQDQGNYDEAEALHYRAFITRKNILTPYHLDIASSLNNLASINMDRGRYSKAVGFYAEALAVKEKSLAPTHPSIILALNNLGYSYYKQGQYIKAEEAYMRALGNQAKSKIREGAEVAALLNNLALLYRDTGQTDKAEILYVQAITVLEDSLGADHPTTANIIDNIATLYSDSGRAKEALPYYKRALSIREKTLGQDHPDTSTTLNNLGLLYADMGDYTEAQRLLQRSLDARKKIFGLDHLEVGRSASNLASIYGLQNKYSQGILSLGQALSIEFEWIAKELPLLPDQDRSAQVKTLGSSWQIPYTWINQAHSAKELALLTRLNRHGLLQEIEQSQALISSTKGEDLNRLTQLKAAVQQLSSIILPVETRTTLKKTRDKLQRDIYKKQPNLQIKQVDKSTVTQVLPSHGALVEIQRYKPFDGRKPAGQRFNAPEYIALILKPDGSINAVQLGPAAAIDEVISKALATSAQDQRDAEILWAQLSEQILKPLLPYLSSSREWFISPDGELNRVPFAALPAPQQPDIPLAQAVQLRLITTGRELVRLQKANPAGSKPLVMANPSFDRNGASTAITTASTTSPEARRRSADLGSTRWSPLPASQQEGQAIASLLSTDLVSGAAATTTTLQRQQGPRVLHIATHGFFVADQESKPTDPLQVVQEQAPQLQGLRQEDPQLRSGLVLAGANQPDADPNDDGYLTAAEAVMLNLKGTELVVLSACSTGQGDIRTGEGVYGLQRSLTVAGARSTLLSLWKVDDAATADFMTRFYTRLKAGEARSDALAATQKEFRDGTAGNGQWTSPFYWAAWQLVGDWRQIPGL